MRRQDLLPRPHKPRRRRYARLLLHPRPRRTAVLVGTALLRSVPALEADGEPVRPPERRPRSSTMISQPRRSLMMKWFAFVLMYASVTRVMSLQVQEGKLNGRT